MAKAPAIVLDSATEAKLESLTRAASTPQALARRAQIILRISQEENAYDLDVAADLRCHRCTVSLWRHRFLADGIAGLLDLPRPGRPPAFSPGGPPQGGDDGDGDALRARQLRSTMEFGRLGPTDAGRKP